MGDPAASQQTTELPSAPSRLERLQQWMHEQGVDAFLAAGAINVAYVTGYWRYYNLPSAAVLEANGRRTLIVTRDEVPVAEEKTGVDHVVPWTSRGFGLDLNLLELLAEAIAAQPQLQEAARVAFADGLGLSAVLPAHLKTPTSDASAAIERLRLVKDAAEIEGLARCYQLAWRAVDAVRDAAEQGASEIEMFSSAQGAAQNAHGEPIEFSADLLCGPNTADDGPRRIAGSRRVATGESVTADIRVAFDGFWSDICETLVVGDNEEISQARATLVEILDNAAHQLRPGTSGAEIYAQVARSIEERFPGGSFPHHAGHAVGMVPIEMPRLMPSDTTPFEQGMVFSIEPGVYFDGRWGARVEKTYVVGPSGGVELPRTRD